MGLHDLLVVLDGTPRDDAKLALASALAQRHDAHLTGLCVLEHLLPPDLSSALGGYPDLWALPEFSRQIEEHANAAAALIEAKFRDCLPRDAIQGDWVLETDSLLPAVLRRAHCADLLVMGQVDPDNPVPAVARTLIEDVLVTAGRPLLLVPYVGTYRSVGAKVLVGWAGTRESARAVHDCLPLLGPGADVTVLTVETQRPNGDAVPGADIAQHLARHGLNVSAARTVVTDGLAPADALLDYASDIGADLLVVGGYGHSRTREMIMGGVTRDLLRHMTVPVLMSH
jgi:nucleotide-binding universal stress UspA family protein